MTLILPALRFEQEAFRIGEDRILGRQSAGAGFLRAILELDGLDEVYGFGPSRNASRIFSEMVSAKRPDVLPKWVAPGASKTLTVLGKVHFPDPVIAEHARQRLVVGANSWSITGITHTVSSLKAMRAIAELTTAPVMEWDGLILTSQAVKGAVNTLLGEQLDYLSWRMPGAQRPPLPQMPVIPLGIHCDDFAFTDEARVEARRSLCLEIDEVAFLFSGRLSFHAKANPYPMYRALEEAALRTGKRIVLIQCGWFANKLIEQTFKQAADRHAPSVRHVWLDGRNAKQRSSGWAGSDIFVSLPDNIQETFGLTPLEAMASGLPVLVSDWNGYRDTVRHGECGIAIPTYAPAAPAGQHYALMHAAEAISYDEYLFQTARHVGVDLARLTQAACDLAVNSELRKNMGEAGRRIATQEFSWAVILSRYLEFWAELDTIRSIASKGPVSCPRVASDRIDPFRLFSSYPTEVIGPGSMFCRSSAQVNWNALLNDPLFSHRSATLPAIDIFAALFFSIPTDGAMALSQASAKAGLPFELSISLATVLLKMGALKLI